MYPPWIRRTYCNIDIIHIELVSLYDQLDIRQYEAVLWFLLFKQKAIFYYWNTALANY